LPVLAAGGHMQCRDETSVGPAALVRRGASGPWQERENGDRGRAETCVRCRNGQTGWRGGRLLLEASCDEAGACQPSYLLCDGGPGRRDACRPVPWAGSWPSSTLKRLMSRKKWFCGLSQRAERWRAEGRVEAGEPRCRVMSALARMSVGRGGRAGRQAARFAWQPICIR